MTANHYSKFVTLSPENNQQLFNLCGKYNEHILFIAKQLNVDIKQRGYTFSVTGKPEIVLKACNLLQTLYHASGPALTPSQLHLYLQTAKHNHQDTAMNIHTKHTTITARGENQVKYLKNIANHDISFGLGPAGTGKTYLAVASAVSALDTGRVSRIVLVRPIVEAGEKLGFLPGDIAEKVHPYLQPLYDGLHEMLGFDHVNQLIERGIIELAPLAYMRGRSLNDAFIILDEGQNTKREQMKMFLTRIGFNSKAVITGDTTQIDLAHRLDSGLIHATEILKDVPGISFMQFQASDVVRHPLVQKIVEAYEKQTKDNQS